VLKTHITLSLPLPIDTILQGFEEMLRQDEKGCNTENNWA